MAMLDTQGISMYYEVHGTRGKPPVLLIAGLGGAGTSWGSFPERFARDHLVVVADQRGTGKTNRPEGGYTVSQIATDMVSVVQHLDVGPVHVVGTSTGGAIGQLEADMHTVYTCYALFLFSPTYTRQNPDAVTAWIDRVSRITPEREIALKRIDMIMAHDVLPRLGEIRTPTLVLGGDHDICLPPELSDELARGIPGATRVTLPGGHMIHDECPEKYFETVRAFIDEH
jgi:aminoacrylate hydrolase